MIPQLACALYLEGPTDERFFVPLVRRILERIVQAGDVPLVTILDPHVLDVQDESDRAEAIREAARRANGYHLLVVHADADARTPDRALDERIEPGFRLVENDRHDEAPSLVSLVPVRMTESWLLADVDALCNEIGGVQPGDVNLPKPRNVETVTDPKGAVHDVIRASGHDVDLRDLYTPLGRRIRLDRLQSVPAYGRFEAALTNALNGVV